MIMKYFRGVVREMKRVRWPKGKELMVAFATVVIFGAFFAILLFGFDWLVLEMLEAVGAR